MIDINTLVFDGVIAGSILSLTIATKYLNNNKIFKKILSTLLGGIIGGKSVMIFNDFFGSYPTMYYTGILCFSSALYLLENEKYFD